MLCARDKATIQSNTTARDGRTASITHCQDWLVCHGIAASKKGKCSQATQGRRSFHKAKYFTSSHLQAAEAMDVKVLEARMTQVHNAYNTNVS